MNKPDSVPDKSGCCHLSSPAIARRVKRINVKHGRMPASINTNTLHSLQQTGFTTSPESLREICELLPRSFHLFLEVAL